MTFSDKFTGPLFTEPYNRPLAVRFADRSHGFVPAMLALIPVPSDVVADLSVEEIAEAVFEATNAPFEVTGLAAIVRAWFTAEAAKGKFYPTLSVGDVVRMGRDGAVRVESVGFSAV